MEIYFKIVYYPNNTIVISIGSAHFKGGGVWNENKQFLDPHSPKN